MAKQNLRTYIENGSSPQETIAMQSARIRELERDRERLIDRLALNLEPTAELMNSYEAALGNKENSIGQLRHNGEQLRATIRDLKASLFAQQQKHVVDYLEH